MPTKAARVASLKAQFPSDNPNKKAAAKTIVSRKLATHIARVAMKKAPAEFGQWLRRSILPGIPRKSDWYKALQTLARNCVLLPTMAADDCPVELFAMDGNSKLPFAAFSALPGLTCPGAGACLDWCYSFKAWRYPGAFARQLFATLVLFHRSDIVVNHWRKLPQNITVRLYVDGDIDSLATLHFWLQLCEQRQDLQVYGYSKSWPIFLHYAKEFGAFPNNYALNLSSGSKYGDDIAERLKACKRHNGAPLVRGAFGAVKIDGAGIPHGAERYNSAEYHRRVREAGRAAFGRPVFSCPGDCGACGNSRHMCGRLDGSADGLPIVIGIH